MKNALNHKVQGEASAVPPEFPRRDTRASVTGGPAGAYCCVQRRSTEATFAAPIAELAPTALSLFPGEQVLLFRIAFD